MGPSIEDYTWLNYSLTKSWKAQAAPSQAASSSQIKQGYGTACVLARIDD